MERGCNVLTAPASAPANFSPKKEIKSTPKRGGTDCAHLLLPLESSNAQQAQPEPALGPAADTAPAALVPLLLPGILKHSPRHV